MESAIAEDGNSKNFTAEEPSKGIDKSLCFKQILMMGFFILSLLQYIHLRVGPNLVFPL